MMRDLSRWMCIKHIIFKSPLCNPAQILAEKVYETQWTCTWVSTDRNNIILKV